MALLVTILAGLADTDLTVYHVNPLHEGVIPVNMDTADLRGDIFFDLSSKTMPIECASPIGKYSSACSNEEVVDHDLVISKLVMTVRGEFGGYGRCNTCNASDIDPFSRLPCHGSAYLCTCGDYEHPHDCNSQKAVGAENITTAFGGFTQCTWENWISYPWMCWGWTVFNKTAGPGVNMWYSSTAAGWCDAPGASPATCTWSARVIKIVNKTCSDNMVHRAVEEYDAEHDGRFAKCPHTKPGPSRNISDPCWIYAFYSTVLGPDALLPNPNPRAAIAGMPTEILEYAFERPFFDEARGGCPAIPPPKENAPRVGARRRNSGRSFGVLPTPPAPQLQAAFHAAAQLAVEEVAERTSPSPKRR